MLSSVQGRPVSLLISGMCVCARARGHIKLQDDKQLTDGINVFLKRLKQSKWYKLLKSALVTTEMYVVFMYNHTHSLSFTVASRSEYSISTSHSQTLEHFPPFKSTSQSKNRLRHYTFLIDCHNCPYAVRQPVNTNPRTQVPAYLRANHTDYIYNNICTAVSTGY